MRFICPHRRQAFVYRISSAAVFTRLSYMLVTKLDQVSKNIFLEEPKAQVINRIVLSIISNKNYYLVPQLIEPTNLLETVSTTSIVLNMTHWKMNQCAIMSYDIEVRSNIKIKPRLLMMTFCSNLDFLFDE